MSESIPPHHDSARWGCGENPFGIGLTLPELEGIDEYEAFLGGSGIVQGGLVAAALDDGAGLPATWHRFPTVTVRIFVRRERAACRGARRVPARPARALPRHAGGPRRRRRQALAGAVRLGVCR